ncbi:MAG: hypothetical protein JRI23_31415 [Deltaproteobacteria bacterium]|jgi:hypothetical protein|nr:hypothetical protein [Deltaproteobacteria bacterium]MBW2536719.1 hypothetical protein [Deltaproteobacteria bacterium]
MCASWIPSPLCSLVAAVALVAALGCSEDEEGPSGTATGTAGSTGAGGSGGTAGSGGTGATGGGGGDSAKAVREQIIDELLGQELNFGVSAPPEWMNETRDDHGTRWKWRAQYFSGGSNHPDSSTNRGWHDVFLRPYNEWENPDQIPGMWGRKWIEATIAAGYMPWITTYNIGQSHPANYQPNAPEAVATNIVLADTMLAYFEQFKLLMEICAEYPEQPMVVHVEPDELGHMLLTVDGDTLDPEAVFVQVGGTGMAELADLPDNVVGYAQAMKRLRDLYAPYNVLLTVSPSPWSWQYRLSADNWQAMFMQSGILEWDLAVCETGSADLGWSGEDPPYGDDTGMAGGIDNVFTWAGDLSSQSGLPFILWQVPIGNTYFRTCDNTPGHYTHNTAQLLLEGYPSNTRLQGFADGGGIGVIFSPGQGTSTRVHDAMEDGITNPAAIPGNEGNTSEYADDDGGYVRLRVESYFQNPIAL